MPTLFAWPAFFGASQLDPGFTVAGQILSNANLTASSTGSTGGTFLSRSQSWRYFGKYFFECTFTTVGTALDVATGVGSAAMINAYGASYPGAGFDGIAVTPGNYQGITLNNVFLGGATPSVDGEIVSVCVDIGNRLFWATDAVMRAAGQPWNNSAIGVSNPATGLGGRDISQMFSPPYYVFYDSHDNSATSATLNFGNTAFSQAIPTGFVAWQEPSTVIGGPRKAVASMVALLNNTSTITGGTRKPLVSMAGLLNETATIAGSTRKPAASMDGLLDETGVLAAVPRKPAASLAGLLNETGTIAAPPRKPLASITGSQAGISTITASPRKPAGSLAGLLNEAATLEGSTRKPLASITASIMITSGVVTAPRKPTSALAAAIGEVSGVAAIPRKPSSEITAALVDIGSITTGVRKPISSLFWVNLSGINSRPFTSWIGR